MSLAAYTEFLRREHLPELAADNLRRLFAMDAPLLKLVATMTPEQVQQATEAGLDKFLRELGDGTALQVYQEVLVQWEADTLPGLPRDMVEPSDMVLVMAAQERAIQDFIPRYTTDAGKAIMLAGQVRDYYISAQDAAMQVFTRLRERAAQDVARAEAEREAAQHHAEELQAQAEELQAQAEELQTLHERLVGQHELVAREVEAKTRELALEKDFIEKLIKHVPTGIVYMDRNGVFRWVNPEYARSVNVPVESFAGRSYQQVFPWAEYPNPRFSAAMESAEPSRQEGLEAPGPDGSPRFWDTVYVPVLGADGQVEGLMIMSQDVTARVRNDQLQQAQIAQLQAVDRMKDEFLSILSHELRTPINAIMGFASILDDEVAGPMSADQHRYAQRILTSSDVLLALIDDLLDMSRIQAGKFTLAPRPIRVGDAVGAALATVAPLADQKGQELRPEVAADLPTVVADAQRVVQVITNLVANAIKFGPQGAAIDVRAFQVGEAVRVEVQDRGEGIAPEDVPRLFERFTQLDTGNTRRAGGTGLGLSIVKALVEAHGGEVGVETAPGEGATFWFTLPVGGPGS